MAGKVGKCPKCQTVIKLGFLAPTPPPLPQQVKIKTKAKDTTENPSWVYRWGIFAMGMTAIGLLLIYILAVRLGAGLFGVGYLLMTSLILGVMSLLFYSVRGLAAGWKNYPEDVLKKYKSRGWIASAISCMAICLMSSRSRETGAIALHYACFLAASWAVSSWLITKWPRQFGKKLCGGLAAALAVVWFMCDYSVSEWTLPPKEYGTYETRYTDYYRRFSENPYYRKINAAKPGDIFPVRYEEGPMTDTVKPHGKWKWVLKDSEDIFLVKGRGLTFYWYGVEVSEGDWHLKNN